MSFVFLFLFRKGGDRATYLLLLQDPLFLPAETRTNKGPASSGLPRPSPLTGRINTGLGAAFSGTHVCTSGAPAECYKVGPH